MRARDIPELVADGAADIGITGRDLLEESARPLDVALDLCFGRCRLAVAVREDSSARGLADLPSRAPPRRGDLADEIARRGGLPAVIGSVEGRELLGAR